MNLLQTDEVLVWIAPGDLASLSDEHKINPPLPTSFLDKYRDVKGRNDHVKVCLRQALVVDLWNIGSGGGGGRQHCHASSGAGSSNVDQFFLGWDGALYCGWNGGAAGDGCSGNQDCMIGLTCTYVRRRLTQTCYDPG